MFANTKTMHFCLIGSLVAFGSTLYFIKLAKIALNQNLQSEITSKAKQRKEIILTYERQLIEIFQILKLLSRLCFILVYAGPQCEVWKHLVLYSRNIREIA